MNFILAILNLTMCGINLLIYMAYGNGISLFCAIFSFCIGAWLLGKDMRTEEEIEEYMKKVKEEKKTMNGWEGFFK